MVTTPPTHTEAGIETRTCSHDSSHTETRAISPVGHNYQFNSFEWNSSHTAADAILECPIDHDIIRVAAAINISDTATCTQDGYIVHTARYEEESESYNYQVSLRKGHTPKAPVEDTVSRLLANCEDDGYHDMVVYCDVCNEEISRMHYVDAAHGHSFTHWDILEEATCTENGREISHCDYDNNETQQRIIPATGHSYHDEKINPTCTEKGYILHTCTKCDSSYKEYNDSDHSFDPLGHRDEDGNVIVPSCLEEQECYFCHEIIHAVGHDYKVTSNTAATCTEHGKTTYTCSRCDDVKVENTSEPLGHSYESEPYIDQVRPGEPACFKEKIYRCTREGCDHEKHDFYTAHSYKSEIIEEANCQNAGTKRYTCTVCGDHYDEVVPLNPENHVWVKGSVKDGIRTDECSVCHTHREVTVMSGNTSANSLAGKEFAVENVSSIKMDEAMINDLKGTEEDVNIAINVSTVEKSTLVGEAASKLDQIGDNTIYDFSLTKNDNPVTSFDGKITITLPYKLSENEDPENIAVWYIDDSGNLSSFEATYANGYVSFETSHFSYYAVTTLTNEERCATYGHSYKINHVDGDCTHGAYDIQVCTRCGDEKIINKQEPIGHNFEIIETNNPTCTNSGSIIRECSHCHTQIVEVIPSTGHSFGDPIEHQDATCEENGYNRYECSVCHQIKTEILYATGHNYIKDTTNPTCESYGFDTYTCSVCGKSYKTNYIAPTGHDYHKDVDHSTPATCTESGRDVYVCGHECGESYTEIVPATGHTPGSPVSLNVVDASCTEDGSYDSVVYCTICGEEVSREHVIVPATGHTPSIPVVENATSSSCLEPGSYDSVVYCSVCDHEISKEHIETGAVGHDWGEWIETTPATCTEPGEATRTCNNDHSHTENKVIPVIDHTPGNVVIENEVAPSCEHDGSHDEVTYCSVCNAEVSRNTIIDPATGHNYGSWIGNTPATCTEPGEETRTCSHDHSHVETREIPATGHKPLPAVMENYVVPTCISEGGYDMVVRCENCGEIISSEHHVIEATGHNFGAWTVTTEPTCTESGVETRVCATDPTHIETREVAPKGHNWGTWVVTTEPTCTNPGEETRTCLNDSTHTETREIEPTGHIWGEWINVTELSCTQDLEQERTCTVPGCNAVEHRVIVVANGHIYETINENVVAPTCTEPGHHDEVSVCKSCGEHDELTRVTINDAPLGHKALPAQKENEVKETCTTEGGYDMVIRCENCGEVISSEHHTIQATGHNFGAWSVVTPATCTEQGLERRICANDPNHIEERAIPALGHTPSAATKENEIEATCVTDGSYDTVVYCSVCHEELSRETHVIEATGHNFGAWTVTKEATCSEYGEETRYCAHDNNHKETRYIEKIAHTPSAAVMENEVAPTCTKEGSYDEVIYCSDCHEELSRKNVVVPALGHEFGEWEVTTEPTCTKTGEETRHCIHQGCEETEVRSVEKLPHNPAEAVVENEVAPGCTTKGHYDLVVYCSDCHEELSRKTYYTNPIGHEYEVSFSYSDDHKVATATFTCTHDAEHVIIKKVNTVASQEIVCSEARDIIYTAIVNYNGRSYTDSITVEGLRLEHTPSDTAVIENVVDPTCLEVGHHDEVIYCDVCHQEVSRETITDDALGHNPLEAVRENERPATCLEAGSYESVIYCDRCHEELERETIELEALGHDYGEWKTTKPATCFETGSESRYCSHDISHVETREIAKLEHVTGALIYNDTHHYHECENCHQHIDEELHDLTYTVTKEATCVDTGIRHGECTKCDYECDISIPATNIHNYVNGVCSVCGKAKGDACDHSELHEETVDFGELGYCGGHVTYQTCECGEVKLIDEESFDIECNIANMSREYKMVEYKGKEYQAQVATCKECGFNYSMLMISQEQIGCTTTMKAYILFADKDGNYYLETSYEYSSTNHRNTKEYVLTYEGTSLAISYQKCMDCQEVTSIDVIDKENVLVWTDEDVVISPTTSKHIETGVYSTGNVKVVKTYIGEYLTTCKVQSEETIEVFEGDKLVVSKSETDIVELHNWEITYELVGESCSDGLNMRRTCTRCGLSQPGYTEGHPHEELVKKQLDFSKYGNGSCGAVINYSECGVCHDASFEGGDASRLMSIHNLKIEGAPTSVTVHGVDGMRATGVCADCGIKVIMTQYAINHSACSYTQYIDVEYYDTDDTLIVKFSKIYLQYVSEHDWHYENVSFLDSDLGCEGGVIYDKTCSKCHETQTMKEYVYYHDVNKEDRKEINIIDVNSGKPLVTGDYYVCQLCKKSCNINLNINYEMFISSKETEIIDGITYEHDIYRNSANNVEIRRTRYDVVEGCYINRHYLTSLSQNGEVIISEDRVEKINNHDLTYNVTFKNEELGCEGGYSGVAYCKNCDYVRKIDYSSGHQWSHRTVSLAEYGACDDSRIELNECKVCGKSNVSFGGCDYHYNEPQYYPDHTENHRHYSETVVCDKCNLSVFIESTVDYGEHCQVVRTKNYTFTIGEHVESFTENNTYNEHNYSEEQATLLGKNCDDGIRLVSKCENCGDIREETVYGHYYRDTHVDFKELGACGGHYVTSECVGCHELQEKAKPYLYVDFGEHHFIDDVNSNTIDENGVRREVHHSVCSECGMEYSHQRTLTPTGGSCEYFIEDNESVIYKGVTYAVNSSFYNTMHTFTDRYVPCGDDCEIDGIDVYRTCDICHFEEFAYHMNGHHNKYINHSIEGFVGAGISYYECEVCNEIQSVSGWSMGDGNVQTNSNEEVIDNITYSINTKTNTDTGLKLIITSWVEQIDQCHIVIHESYVFKDGDNNILFEVEIERMEEKHSYTYSFEFMDKEQENCEDGVYVTGICKYCGEQTKDEIHYHQRYAIDSVDLSEYGAPAGTNLVEYSCPCGYEKSVSLDFPLPTASEQGETPVEDLPSGAISQTITHHYTYGDDEEYRYNYIETRYYVEDGSCETYSVIKYEFGVDEKYQNPTYVSKQFELVHDNEYIHQAHQSSERIDLAGGQYQTIDTYTCERCGKTNVYKKTYTANNILIKEERDINYFSYQDASCSSVKDNEIYIYDNEEYVRPISYSYKEMKDGASYSYVTTYSYDDDDPCHVTEITKYPESETSDSYYNHLYTSYGYYNEASCAHDGINGDYCIVCGKMSDGSSYEEAHGHKFIFDEDSGLYVCSSCGLKSNTDVQGYIIFEDSSDDSYYRVDYKLLENISYSVYVSIINKETNEETILNELKVGKQKDANQYYVDKYQLDSYFNDHNLSNENYDVKMAFVSNDASYDEVYSIIF